MSGLRVDVTARRGAFTLTARLTAADGAVLAVLGPNGSGKSTLLDVVAGLLPLERGEVRWRERALSEAGRRPVPPASRRVGLLRQDPALFPHLSAAENVAFGLRSQREPGAPVLAGQWLERLGVSALADRRPGQLSGGQAARVALARALAARPEVLLLDEPLAALDAAAAPQLRQLLAEIVREERLTTVLVSHDVLDAALLADRIAVLRDGAVVEEGTRAEVLEAPRTEFTAAFVGVNLVPAGFGGLRAGRPGAPGARQLRFRPAAVEITAGPGERENAWSATVRWLEPVTGGVRVRLATQGQPDVVADLDAAGFDPTLIRPGATVSAHVPPEAVQGV